MKVTLTSEDLSKHFGDQISDEVYQPVRYGFHNYIVTWRIELTAKTPQEAVRQAREIQLDSNNTATSFEVAIDYELQNTPQGEN